jgi:hypothetical protein
MKHESKSQQEITARFRTTRTRVRANSFCKTRKGENQSQQKVTARFGRSRKGRANPDIFLPHVSAKPGNGRANLDGFSQFPQKEGYAEPNKKKLYFMETIYI